MNIVIIMDRNRQIVFAIVAQLSRKLLEAEFHDLMIRAVDMWSFYMPMPKPKSRRHVFHNHLRKVCPGVDMSEATIDQLRNAKMFAAHYGCWMKAGHHHDPQCASSPHERHGVQQWPGDQRRCMYRIGPGLCHVCPGQKC